MDSLLAWWNLVYLLPFAIAILYLMVTLLTGLGEGHDVGHDHDIAHEVGHDADHGADGDVDHDLGDADGDGSLFDALEFLGAGRIPTTLLLEVFFVLWGALGLSFNSLLSDVLPEPARMMAASLVLTFVSTVALTRGLSGVLARVMPREESYALGREDLVGLVGRTIFHVDDRGGAAHLHDRYDNLHQVACRTEEPVARGVEVVLTEYVSEGDYYLVEPLPDEHALAETVGVPPTVPVQRPSASDPEERR